MSTAASLPTVGCTAPTFTLPDQNGRPFSLSDLLGQWIVLYFYPKDDTPGCTTEACDFTNDFPAFQDLKARVIGVSPDSPESHRKFIAKRNLKIELLSDPDHEVLEMYGAWSEKTHFGIPWKGVVRSTVIIDPKGRIAHHWPNVRAAGHADEVRRKLQELAASM
jgi:thioredoxin-dependent peroxiredoxin